MVIEVAKGEGAPAREAMRRRIRNGDMKNVGITDEAMADQLVKEGWFTQGTAKRIAKAGTIEGITYDAVNTAVERICNFSYFIRIDLCNAYVEC